jgi:hypothetical protein
MLTSIPERDGGFMGKLRGRLIMHGEQELG